MNLTQEYLKECLTYTPETGEFVWKERPREHFNTGTVHRTWNTKNSGNLAGSKDAYGYLVTKVMGKSNKNHRLAWLYVYGEFPPEHMDHINGDPSDNRLSNLRSVTRKENMRNRKLQGKNTIGIPGVWLSKTKRKWMATIGAIEIGRFDSLNDAASARYNAEREHGYHENHGRVA